MTTATIKIRCTQDHGLIRKGEILTGKIVTKFNQTRVELDRLPSWTAHPDLFFNRDGSNSWKKFEIAS